MRRIVVDPLAPDPVLVREAAAVLAAGGVVAFPTDTLYGLAVDPSDDAAVSRLFAVKGRDRSAAIPLIAGDKTLAGRAGRFGRLDHRLADAFWPGPLTLVVPAAASLSAGLSPHGTIGVRVPAHAVARALSLLFGQCVTATSANRTGTPSAATPDEVAARLMDEIDLLLDGGPAPGGPPSTVVEIVDGRPTLHRAGVVSWNRVLESVE